jgi:hypothetical protein
MTGAFAKSDLPRLLEMIGTETKAAIEKLQAPLLYRLAAAEAEIAVLKGKPSIKYCGIHEPGKHYQPGDGVTHDGSLWICKTETSAKPGDDYNGWQLAARKGRDGRR